MQSLLLYFSTDPCLRKPPGFSYADGQSCYGFYQCVKGKSRYLTCHDGYYFNPYKQGCFPDPSCHRNNLVHREFPEIDANHAISADCNLTRERERILNYEFFNNIFTACAFGTTLPFPGRPNLFYLYDGRKTMTPMKCPRGTWYRPDICTCDWIIPGKVEKEGKLADLQYACSVRCDNVQMYVIVEALAVSIWGSYTAVLAC